MSPRPAIDPSERRSEILGVRLTASEKEAVEKAAMPGKASDWARSAILRAVEQHKQTKTPSKFDGTETGGTTILL